MHAIRKQSPSSQFGAKMIREDLAQFFESQFSIVNVCVIKCVSFRVSCDRLDGCFVFVTYKLLFCCHRSATVAHTWCCVCAVVCLHIHKHNIFVQYNYARSLNPGRAMCRCRELNASPANSQRRRFEWNCHAHTLTSTQQTCTTIRSDGLHIFESVLHLNVRRTIETFATSSSNRLDDAPLSRNAVGLHLYCTVLYCHVGICNISLCGCTRHKKARFV